MRSIKIALLPRVVVFFGLFSISLMLFPSCSGTRPANVAEGHNRLAACPETPNCVSTQATDGIHAMKPLPYTSDTKEAMRVLIGVIRMMKRAEIVAQKENYLYAQFTSAFFRFVDDVEFSFNEERKIIHFRSASRLGKSDFGVNRKRMEEISSHFLRLTQKTAITSEDE